jgi:DNA repair protein RecO (recombination protein O)
MLVSTKAIVIHSLKYSDTSLIVKLFTEKEGIKSYLLKGVLNKKSNIKIAFFQPLNLLEIVANHNNKGALNIIKELQSDYHFQSIPTNIVKQSMLLFLAEVLNSTLIEDGAHESLFEYLKTALIWLDSNEKSANFHLLFLLNLTKYLGFYPETSQYNAPIFDLEEGKFSFQSDARLVLINNDLLLFKSLLGTNFDNIEQLKLNAEKRHQMLNILIQYFELHISGFKKPKSLSILKSIFE